jgi:hypothetical protein
MSQKEWQGSHTDAQLTQLLSSNQPVKVAGKDSEHFSTKLKPADVTGLISVIRSFK